MITAIDLNTGKELWETFTSSAGYIYGDESVVVGGGNVYVIARTGFMTL